MTTQSQFSCNVSTVCADEADAARVTSTFGAQASNAPRDDAEQSDEQS